MTTVHEDRDSHRNALIAGLIEFAGFLAAHPDLPLPPYPNMLWSVGDVDDEEGRSRIAAIADAMDVPVEDDNHVTATRQFAVFGVRAYFIPKSERNNEVAS